MYIVVGGSGFFGHYVIKTILKNTTEQIIATYTNSLPDFANERLTWVCSNICNENDILNLNALAKGGAKVILLSAYSSPDFCEKNPKISWDLNVTAVSNFINKFEKAGCLYFASTDVVYGEGSTDKKFDEKTELNPSNQYGLQKSLAEKLVLAKGFNVFRLPLMMGKSLVSDKKHFFDIIVGNLSENKSIEMYTDSLRTTLHFSQCANFLIEIIEKYGSCEEKVINFASDNLLSKYDLGIKIAKEYGLNCDLIKPISLNENETIFGAKRAAVTYMENSLLKKLLGLNSIDFVLNKGGNLQ